MGVLVCVALEGDDLGKTYFLGDTVQGDSRTYRVWNISLNIFDFFWGGVSVWKEKDKTVAIIIMYVIGSPQLCSHMFSGEQTHND